VKRPKGLAATLLAAALCLPVAALGAAAHAVKDINTLVQDGGLGIAGLTKVGGVVYFKGSDGANGQELWRSDGTPEGTFLVRDIAPGTRGSAPDHFVDLAGALFFAAANDGIQNSEPWRSDGTPAGTTMIKDINPGSGGAIMANEPKGAVNINGSAYVAAVDDVGFGLWKSDGTVDGTSLVKRIDYLSFLFPYAGGAFFSGPGGLWKSDGTASGTVLVKTLSLGPSFFAVANGWLYFAADDGSHGKELWKSDGTPEGTLMVADINPGAGSSSPSQLTNLGGTLLFEAGDGVTGAELWKSDGTGPGTSLVKDILPGNSYPGPQELTVVGDALFFAGNDGATVSLWKSDGTTSGTVLVKNVTPASLVNVGGVLFFTGYNAGPSPGLWKSDGTDSGTVLIKDMIGVFPPGGGIDFNGVLLFASGSGLWRSDGTESGTVLVKGVGQGGSSAPSLLTASGSRVFFTADDGVHGGRWWETAGSAPNTHPVLAAASGYPLATPFLTASPIADADGTLFFAAALDDDHGVELWKLGGSVATLVKEIAPGPTSSNPDVITSVGNRVFFAADDWSSGESDRRLWRSDGTAAGTVKLAPSSHAPLYVSRLANLSGTLFFVGFDRSTLEYGLWRSDGTVSGTRFIKSFGPEDIDHLTAVGARLFFTVDGELWVSNGRSSGTLMVQSFPAYSPPDHPSGLTAVQGTLYFAASDEAHGRELWKSDGTPAGTQMVLDINPGPASSNPSSLTASGWRLFFFGDDGVSGNELWKSDGTALGTAMVRDIAAGLESGAVPSNVVMSSQPMTALGTDVVFAGYAPEAGLELWRSDGTESGTALVADINPGPGSSEPASLTTLGNCVFFSANDGTTGVELWVFPPPLQTRRRSQGQQQGPSCSPGYFHALTESGPEARVRPVR
jgi:ELWxxDGT repeat protein